MSLSDEVPVETVNKDINQNVHERWNEEEESIEGNNEPPPLNERNKNDESSVESSGSDIDWNPEDLILEFRQTYQD